MYEVYLSRHFDRNLKKITKNNPRLKIKIRDKVETLLLNPKHVSLRLHKLSEKNNWSISITSDIRIIFTIDENKILLNRIGGHDDVY